ncbi:alanine racemase [Thioalkalicoccus limnaeus]|uniref:Alanine racemase n=1 Tax=Thioalkalicoccus limnaeus TaxID=120681 RepID=A0ABV4BD40_9GAMM
MSGFTPRALLDPDAFRHNLAQVRRYAPTSRVWAVIKANAYGHGAEWAAAVLNAAEGFAVARTDEGARLRRAGASRPILVLEGPVDTDELEAAVELDLTLALHRWGQVELLPAVVRGRLPKVWIKVDTGMHRLGFPPERVPAVLDHLIGSGVPIAGLLTHLANADVPEDPRSAEQCEQLRRLAGAARWPLSIGNSAGLIAVPAARSDWVRPGIMLYGVSPFATGTGADLGLVPVMTLQGRLIAIQQLRRGAAVGYGGTYICPEDMPVGVVNVGYGDGYPRHAVPGTPVLIAGRRVPLIGRVSMDMIHVDLRPCPQAAVGELATLWGSGLPVEEVAACAGTIPYELLCRVAPRVRLEVRSSGPAPSAP